MIELLIPKNLQHFRFSVVDNGIEYLYTLRYSARIQRWIVSVHLADGTPVCTGRKLANGIPIVPPWLRRTFFGIAPVTSGVEDYPSKETLEDWQFVKVP
jgi:hypothetical protein